MGGVQEDSLSVRSPVARAFPGAGHLMRGLAAAVRDTDGTPSRAQRVVERLPTPELHREQPEQLDRAHSRRCRNNRSPQRGIYRRASAWYDSFEAPTQSPGMSCRSSMWDKAKQLGPAC